VLFCGLLCAILPEGKLSDSVKTACKLSVLAVFAAPIAAFLMGLKTGDNLLVENSNQAVIKLDSSFIDYCCKSRVESLKKQINDGRKYRVASLPNNRSLSRTGEVVVKLETAQWDQGSPYNQLLPIIDGQLAPTGCVITATAIIMRYHKWPEHGTGTIPGYTTQTLNITLPAIKLGHTYEWDKMPLIYKYNEYTQEERNQVAQLMLELGTMLGADYHQGETSTYAPFIPYRLSTYMG
jgi:hypothetical protein